MTPPPDLKSGKGTSATEKIEVVDFSHDVVGNEQMYPDIAFNLASAIREGEFERGLLFCGTGIGMAIVANKVPGVRAAQCHDIYSAERA
jgi:ribose 5-phosphate isomerase B